MPITTSAIKARRQSVRRRKQNIRHADAYRMIAKELKQSIASGNIDAAQKLIPSLYKALDKAAKINAIKKNKASRLKSRLTKKFSTKK